MYASRFHSVLHCASKSPQIHVVQDLQNGKPSRSFGVVILLKVSFRNTDRLIATCSLCHMAPSLRQYVKGDFSQTISAPFNDSLFMGCDHTQYVIGSVLYQVMADFDTSPEAIESAILLYMTETIQLSVGWYDIPDELPFSGTHAVYVSEHWDEQVLKVYLYLRLIVHNRSKEIRYQCLRCSKDQSKTCVHCHITTEDYHGYIAKENTPLLKPIRVIEDMVSSGKYPLDVSSDLALSKIIAERAIQGGMWYYQRYPDKQLSAGITSCPSCKSEQLELIRATRKITTFATVYTATLFLESFQVYNTHCCNCSKVIPFDGRDVGLINFRNTDIFPG